MNIRAMIYALLPAAIWTVYLLAFYPGMMSPDSVSQWKQITDWRLNDWSPAMYALGMWVVTRAWHSPAAVAVVQVVLTSLFVGTLLAEMERLGVARLYVWLADAFYGGYILTGIFTVTLLHDAAFAICYLWLICIALGCLRRRDALLSAWRSRIAMASCLALLGLFSHNGLAAALGALAGFWIAFPHQAKAIGIIGILFLALFLTINGPIFASLRVQHYTVDFPLAPLEHQVAAIFYYDRNAADELGSSDRAYLTSVLPMWAWVKYYNPYTGDFLRGFPYNDVYNRAPINRNPKRFLGIWVRLMLQHPAILLRERMSEWSLLWRFGGYYNMFVSPLGIDKNPFGFRTTPIWPAAHTFLLKAYQFIAAKGVWLIRPAWAFWLELLLIVLLLRYKREYLALAMPLLFHVAGLLIAIESQDVRYFYPVFLSVPPLGALGISALADRRRRERRGAVSGSQLFPLSHPASMVGATPNDPMTTLEHDDALPEIDFR